MKLLPNEEIVESSFRGLTLTTHRLRLLGGDECAGMFLRDIALVELKYQVNTYWLVLALTGAAAVVFGYRFEELVPLLLGMISCILGGVVYVFTRKRKFAVTSAGGSRMSFSASEILSARVVGLLEGIEGRKLGAA